MMNPMEVFVDQPEGVSLFNTATRGYFACYEADESGSSVECNSDHKYKKPVNKIRVEAGRKMGSYILYFPTPRAAEKDTWVYSSHRASYQVLFWLIVS
jgi:hypothetical protein